MPSIVVIEDNPQTVRMVTKLLVAHGFTVRASQTGEEGLLSIMGDMPDLVLVDLGLPDLDGQTVVAIIRQQTGLATIPVIAFTAWMPSMAHQMAKAYGCDGVITKPIDTRAFARQIESFLPQSALADKETEKESGLKPDN